MNKENSCTRFLLSAFIVRLAWSFTTMHASPAMHPIYGKDDHHRITKKQQVPTCEVLFSTPTVSFSIVHYQCHFQLQSTLFLFSRWQRLQCTFWSNTTCQHDQTNTPRIQHLSFLMDDLDYFILGDTMLLDTKWSFSRVVLQHMVASGSRVISLYNEDHVRQLQ